MLQVERESFTHKLCRCQADCAVVTDPALCDDEAVDTAELYHFWNLQVAQASVRARIEQLPDKGVAIQQQTLAGMSILQ